MQGKLEANVHEGGESATTLCDGVESLGKTSDASVQARTCQQDNAN